MEPLEPLKPLNHWNMVNMVISADGLLDMLVNIRVKLVILIWFNHIVYYCTFVKRYIFVLLQYYDFGEEYPELYFSSKRQ